MEKVTQYVVLLITAVVLCTAKPLNPDMQNVTENPVNVSVNQGPWITLSSDRDTDGEPDDFYVTDDEDGIRVDILTDNDKEGLKMLNILADNETDNSEVPEYSADIIPDFIANSGIEISNISKSDFIDFLVASVTDESDSPKVGDSVAFFTDSNTDESDITKVGGSVNFLTNPDNGESNFTNVGDSVGFPTDSYTEESDNMDIGDPVDFLTDRNSEKNYIPETTANPAVVVTELKYTEYPLNGNNDQLSGKSDFSRTGIVLPGVLPESYPEVSEEDTTTTSPLNKIADQFSDEPDFPETIPSTPLVLTTTLIPTVVHTESANQTDSENSLDFLTDPDVPKAIEATKKLNEVITKYEQNTTREIDNGFEFLNMTARFQFTRGLKKKHLVKRVKRELIPFIGDNEKLINIIGTFVEYIEDEDEEHPELLFAIISDVGNGHVIALMVHYKQREDGKYNFRKVKFSGKFKLAAALIITRISKSNSTISETKDVISYLPREDATQNDVTELMDIMVPRLGRLLYHFSPDTTST